jgi:5-methylcytosine-specific restriction endonuclease McrA
LHNGGTNELDNLVALCRDCHGKKTAMDRLNH